MILPLIVILGIALAFYMAWNIGANDVANSMATAVGAEAISIKQAVIIAGVLEFSGAVLAGQHVADTVRKGIIDPAMSPNILLYGSLAALLAAGFWITLSTWKSLPVSTTHSIIGGLVGFGLIAQGSGVVNWIKLGQVVASWFISPVFGGIMGYLMYKIISRVIVNTDNPTESVKNYGPIWVGLTFFLVSMALLLKTVRVSNIISALRTSLIIGVAAGLIGFFLIRRFLKGDRDEEKLDTVNKVFRNLQVMTSCYVAFSHGANDVANAIGPLATIYNIGMTGTLQTQVPVPIWLLGIGGVGISIGVATWGYKVIATVGKRITHLNNISGFAIDFSAATTVLLASRLGLPISTSHTVVGTVVGVGLTRGVEAVDTKVIWDIVKAWLFTVPAAAIVAALLFQIFGSIGLV